MTQYRKTVIFHYLSRIGMILCLSLFTCNVVRAKTDSPLKNQRVLNIFGWYEQIPADLIAAFEKETGIKVNLDFFDSNATLEAKVISGNTGYDIVFPTSWPHLARHVKGKIYRPLNKEKLKNYGNLDPTVLKKVQGADPNNTHFIPYFWGLVAIGYNKPLIKRLIKDPKLDSWDLIFKLENAQAIKPHGISLLEDATDVFLTFAIYQGLNPQDINLDILRTLRDGLLKLRPNYRRFANTLVTDQLMTGEFAMVLHWSEFLTKAKGNYNGKGKDDIEIFLPKEGTIMWVDGMAIPKDARNVDEAHEFIDFMLRAQSAAMITNTLWTATAVKAAEPLIKKEIKNNETLFPPPAYMEKVYLPEIRSNQNQRFLIRFFSSVLVGRSG